MSRLTGDLDRYSLGDALGTPGGYGSAHAATREDGEQFVVKLIHGFRDPSAEELARLETMLERLGLVRSPNVVPIVDAGIDRALGGDLPWIAMPHVEGARSLRDVMAKAALPLGVRAAARIGRDITAGLADLHDAGLLHRDLKPGNVLIGGDGRARLIDFDLIKIADLITRTPRAHEPLGTEAFMAPEQRLGPVIPQTDLWALGLILVELLTGKQPVLAAARGRDGLRRAALTAHLVPGEIPQPWRELCETLLRKVPVARPINARTVLAWFDDPAGVVLSPPALEDSPALRWSLKSAADVEAAEHGAPALHLDADEPACRSARRLRAAADRLGGSLGLEPQPQEVAQLAFGDLEPNAQTDMERVAHRALRDQALSPADVALLPAVDLDEFGCEHAVDVLRAALRHRGAADGKPVIATVSCRTGSLVSTGSALEIAAALTALNPDGWRLNVEGLDPGCGAGVITAVADMAAALAARAETWVRASGLARWAIAPIPGASVMYRAGRGLWTRPGGGGGGWVPERVEISRLAGPAPREAAERLQAARPDLVTCLCPVCGGRRGHLPAPGWETIVHNVHVVAQQLDELRRVAAADRPSHAVEVLERALDLRATVSRLVDWHAEVADVEAVLETLDARPARLALLSYV